MDDNNARIALNGEFGAADLDDVLRHLAEVRASLKPSVPESAPTALSTRTFLEQDETSFKIATLAAGGMRIWLRHEGFGWLAFNLSAHDTERIRQLLAKQIGSPPAAH